MTVVMFLLAASMQDQVLTADRKGNWPLSPEMVLLERDTGPDDYAVILRDMIPTELAAEWQRAVNPDDATAFANAREESSR